VRQPNSYLLESIISTAAAAATATATDRGGVRVAVAVAVAAAFARETFDYVVSSYSVDFWMLAPHRPYSV
jgi:hypothetical protein